MSRHDAREMAFQLLYQLDVRPEEDEMQIEDFVRGLEESCVRYEAKQALDPSERAQLDEDESDLEKLHGSRQSEQDMIFFRKLVDGVQSERDELDALLQNYLKDWRFARLPKVDRALLRMGAYEILHCPEVPKSVSISEIVLLARRYADDISKRYINGVLANFDKPDQLEGTNESMTGDADMKPEASQESDAKIPVGEQENGEEMPSGEESGVAR